MQGSISNNIHLFYVNPMSYSKLFDRKTEYDALTEYYFVDYHCIIDCRWVRCAYLTLEEVREIIENLPYLYDKENSKTEPMFSNLRITPMRELERLNQVYNEETNEWEDDIITNACKEYDWRYDNYEFLGAKPSLTKKAEETMEEWKERVETRKLEESEVQWKRFERNYKLVEKWDEYPNRNVAFLVGKSMLAKGK